MSVAAIYKALAKEFSVTREQIGYAYESLAAGLRPAYLASFRKAEIGNLPEAALRRLDRRRRQLEDVDARRANVLKTLPEGDPRAERTRRELEACLERWQLDNLLVALRNPEPEVQLALDRGLGPLADELVVPATGGAAAGPESEADASDEGDDGDEGEASADAPVESGWLETAAEAAEAREEIRAEASEALQDAAGEEPSEEAELASGESVALAAGEPAVAAQEPEPSAGADPGPRHALTKVDCSPELARLCQPYVNPDRGLHTDEQVLEGALRILSDRLGRDSKLRGTLRRMALKNARISVRSLGDEKKLARARSLLKLDAPLSQIQGHRLLALRQALMLRQVALVVRLDPALAVPKVRAALCRRPQPAYASALDAVAERSFWRRLVPFLEEEVKHELRERAEDEALRFLGQSLRHVLLAAPYGPRPVAGLDVNPKGDWTIVVVDADGVPGPEHKLEASTAEPQALAEALAEPLGQLDVRCIAVGNGKSVREATRKLREVIHLRGADATVFPVNEAGLSSYANSEFARAELSQYSVPARMAISLGRRLQDPLSELLKTDVRHLGLGREQSVVSKANLRRLIGDSLESCVAFVGCDVNKAPVHVLRHVPGLDFEIAKKIVERRAERPFQSREELRGEGLLDGVRWTNAAGFLVLASGAEPLERTLVHPEQYEQARAVCALVAPGVEEALGKSELLRRLRRPDDQPEPLWRDLVRALGRAGRDARPRLWHPRLLAPDTQASAIAKDTVVEGIVVSVTSFGVFVDLGVPQDGMIHISELSTRYVRDAREMLSVGQIIRARVLDASGPRIELSLKNVPEERREPRVARSEQRARGAARDADRGERRRPGRREPRTERQEAWQEHQPVVRAARSRRDGLAGSGAGRGEGRGEGRRSRSGDAGGGAGGGGKRGAGGRKGARGPSDDGYDADAVQRTSRGEAGSYNPFAAFFKERREEATE